MNKPPNRRKYGRMNPMIRGDYLESTESMYAGLVRTAASSVLPSRFVLHMRARVLKWLLPQLTERTRPLYDEITSLVDQIDKERPRSRLWHPPMTVRVSSASRRADQGREAATRAQIMVLFERADISHRMEPLLASQEAFRKAQSARASGPKKFSEYNQKQAAKRYWEAVSNGTVYGLIKRMENDYSVSRTTINTAVKKYKPDSIDK